ncbi:MAG: ABC transporter permease subunit [Thermaerobacter sp.]|nr:ABC transporter permease subunit [Thermaerobacter sp.]
MRAIALLTLREMLRRRTTVAIALAVLLVVSLSGWAFHALVSSLGPGGEAKLFASEQLVFVMLVFSGILALAASFLSAAAVAPELESGVALSLLARPLTRLRYILGKWIGLAALITGFSLVTGGAEFLTVFGVVGYTPPHPALALLALTAEAILLMTLSLFLSTRLPTITSAIISMVLFFLAWMAGVAGTIGNELHSGTLVRIGEVAQLVVPTNGLWQAAEYFLEPSSVLVLGQSLGRTAENPFIVLVPQTAAFYGWAVLWLLAFLLLSIWSMRRREL